MVNSLSSRSHYTLTFTQTHRHHRRRCMSTHRLLYAAAFFSSLIFLLVFTSIRTAFDMCWLLFFCFLSFIYFFSLSECIGFVFFYSHLHAINTYKRSHWINFCIGSDQILRGAFRLNSNRLHAHNANLFMYIICPFFSSFRRAILSAWPDQCGAKRALADKKGVFVRTIIASFLLLLLRAMYGSWHNNKHKRKNCTKACHLFGLCFYERFIWWRPVAGFPHSH